MNRKMKRRIIVVSLLTLALIVGVQGSVLAKATKVDVKGDCDLTWTWPLTGKQWRDGANHLHMVDTEATGGFSLYSVDGDGFVFSGWQKVILSCNLADYYGPCHGTIAISDEKDGTVFWEGRIQLTTVDRMTSGQIVAHGRGPYEGTQLKLDWQERDDLGPNPDVFKLAGRLQYPHGE